MAMTKERIDEMRRHWLNPDGVHYTTTPNLVAAVTALGECLDEITRLQAIKPAPTRADVMRALRNTWLWYEMKKENLPAEDAIAIAADALAAANLFQETEREEGWYWVRWQLQDRRFVPAWTEQGFWMRDGILGNAKPAQIGPRIPDPPTT